MEFTGERMIPGKVDKDLEIEHLMRYQFASQFVAGKSVLDASCGAGYGSAILAKDAKSVDGLDISEETIAYAKENYRADNIHYTCGSIASLPFADASFDVYVSFETLEHVDEKTQKAFLQEALRVLKADGILIVSTPNKNVYDKRGHNDFHVKELTYTEFHDFLNAKFSNIHFLSQQWELSMSLTANGTTHANLQLDCPENSAEYLIAICSNRSIMPYQTTAWIQGPGRYQELLDWAIENHEGIESRNNHIKRLDAEIESNRKEIKDRDKSISDRDSMIRFRDGEIQKLSVHCNDLQNAVEESNNTLTILKNNHKAELQRLTKEKNQEIADIKQSHTAEMALLEKEYEARCTQIKQDKEQEISKIKQELEATCAQIEQDKANEIAELNKSFNSTLADLQQTLQNKEGHIEQLLESDRELERIKGPYESLRMELDAIKASRSWRLAQFFARIASAIIPRGSRRRVVLKLFREFFRHPGAYLKKCTPSHIGRFLRTLRKDGASRASSLIDEFNQAHCLADVTTSMVLETVAPPSEEKPQNDYVKLSVPQWTDPTVSIVIPVYNQFDYTYLCIKSILENSGTVKYEIIIADDCSSDLTTQIEDIISGLVVIHNKENLRFLLNCNNAAKSAKGKYVLFLNNDTQVQSNWLQPLVDLIDSSDDIGMVGSKLVYPDGKLQEAGGILWRDGSAWNFGNKDNPDLPQYNYVKEADYISGAAIMIRHALWKEIGGFDELFVPAYCEDSDLAFEVRKHGYRVLYQPKSVVVHFEGVSNGTDTSSGQKAYQIENQKKFFEKWKSVLETEHYPNGENVFSARDKSGKKKTILIIDHYIPQYDKDAGSRTMDNFIRVLVGMGYNVKFLGDNFYYDPQYAPHYEQMGVEMICGNYYYNHWKEWIIDNSKVFDSILLSRPHISIKYIDFLRSNMNARLIYYVQDLHYLREEREYEITHDPECLRIAAEVKKQEFYLMEHSDFVLTPSTLEREIINKEIPGDKAEAIPIYCYTSFCNSKIDLTNRNNIVFVGGFTHRPNEDGILWFMESVWPSIKVQLHEARLIIVGSNPTDKVKALAGTDVTVTGYISDEELQSVYANSRICIIPLRYGAGVKGKTLEALYQRIPIVSTSVGLEGLEGIEDYVKPADDAKAFADSIITFYNDPVLAAKTAERYHAYLQQHNSFNAIADIFRIALNEGDSDK